MTEPFIEDREMFEIANRAFDLFTLDERHRALTEFARLRYDSISDRLIDAVHHVIHDNRIAEIREDLA